MSGEDEPDAAAMANLDGIPPAPTSLPPARARARRGGPARTELEALVRVVTPILGGGAQPRELDELDVIRPATVRGHLRFWWRALRGHEFKDAAELYKVESSLWGRAAVEQEGGRSAVEIRINVQHRKARDDSAIRMNDPNAYALWPAREERREQKPTAPRWSPGTQFLLTLVVPTDHEAEVRAVVRAWLLFGGYGGRTRRGLGSFQSLDRDGAWLPVEATPKAFEACFGRNIFLPSDRPAGDTPWLAGASLHIGRANGTVERAWLEALEWLREFRQGTQLGARQPPKGGRPSISNWPEADKVRRLSRPRQARRWAHTPRHSATPVWPRAAFGLPIIGQFQGLSREPRPGWRDGDRDPKNLRWHELPPEHPNHGDEPEQFEIGWKVRGELEPMERLASPLIVKALSLADGRFVPCALWLHRAFPADGEVGLVRRHGTERRLVKGTEAQFDRLVAKDDTPRFAPLAGKQSLREAFLDWLRTTQHTTAVAP